MKIVKQEQGYTLLLTLILIIIIVSLFSTFAFGAITQQKQVEITDGNYEVVAVTEMGVEYYRGSILNYIEFFRQKTISEVEEITNSSVIKESEKREKIDDINFNNMTLLRSAVSSLYKKNPTEETILEPPLKKYFKMKSVPAGLETNVLDISVLGKTNNNEKTISAKFKFPTYLVTLTPHTGGDGGGDGSNGSENGDGTSKPTVPSYIAPPNFSQSFPSNKCIEPIAMNKIPCYTNNLSTLTGLNNNIVYYTGNEIKNFPQSPEKDYYNSYIYANGKVYFTWLNNNKNLSIQLKGEGHLPQFKRLDNISVYIQGKGYHDELSGNKYTLYGEENQEFKSTVELENSIIEIKGEAKFKNSSSFKNDSKLSITHNTTFMNTANFDKSKLFTSGISVFQNSVILKNDSILAIYNTANFDNTIDVEKSKLNITGASTFKNDLRISESVVNLTDVVQAVRINAKNNSTVCLRKSVFGNPGLTIDNSSNIFILDDTGQVKKNTSYGKWGDKDPTFLSSQAFDEKCPNIQESNEEGGSTGTTYENTIVPKFTEDTFTINIEYEEQNKSE